MIRCPICLEPLHQDKPKRCYACANRHSFDVAKEGYINLLRNQPDAGDNKQMIQARHAMMNTTLFQPLMNRLVELLTPYQLSSLLDAGCGEGTYLRTITSKLSLTAIGIDISKNAIRLAAKQDSKGLYLVASNYQLPLLDNSVDGIINIFAPHCEDEFIRVSKQLIMKVVPATHHLIEIKQQLYDEVVITQPKIVRFPHFSLIHEEELEYSMFCTDIATLIQMTPFYYTTDDKRLQLTTNEMDITLHFHLYCYVREVNP